nr:MAG TPA: hypothetical protein [Caudoviricetes sp.]
MLLDSPTGSATYLPLQGSINEIEIILLTFFPSAICPHWLKSNSTPPYRCNVILRRHISEVIYCYFLNSTTGPTIII